MTPLFFVTKIQNMKVLKFGGSSVGSPETIKQVIDIVINQDDDIVVVVSAFKGITDLILKISEDAEQGKENYKEEITKIRNRHQEAIEKLSRKLRKSL